MKAYIKQPVVPIEIKELSDKALQEFFDFLRLNRISRNGMRILGSLAKEKEGNDVSGHLPPEHTSLIEEWLKDHKADISKE